ncbi:hypothetical protein LIA77_00994 [Sarocladium implicatum]|nr:hypothetical protein LIA77_00994 [Sarocladium implicatum]
MGPSCSFNLYRDIAVTGETRVETAAEHRLPRPCSPANTLALSQDPGHATESMPIMICFRELKLRLVRHRDSVTTHQNGVRKWLLCLQVSRAHHLSSAPFSLGWVLEASYDCFLCMLCREMRSAWNYVPRIMQVGEVFHRLVRTPD